MEINDIIVVLTDYPTLYKFLILFGLVLIIVGLVSSIIIRKFKIQARTLTRNQSIMLVVIGCILILIGGMAVWSSLTSPPVYSITIEPPSPIIVHPKGTPVNITVNAEDPGKNIFQEIFGPPVGLVYEFSLLTPNGTLFRNGPTSRNQATFVLLPSDIGESISESVIVIGVGKSAPSGFVELYSFNFTIKVQPLIIRIQNFPPKIISIYSSKLTGPIGSTILISAEANDPDAEDMLYYWFFRKPPRSENFYEIPPLRNYGERERFWTPNASDIGNNTIRVEVVDGTERGPYVDRITVREDLILNIYDPRKTPSGELL